MDLRLEKAKLHLRKVEVGKAEMEFKILERQDDIERMRANIVVQDGAIDKLKKEIKGLKGADNG